jgi:adenine/guanine/hypoxanthine permease
VETRRVVINHSLTMLEERSYYSWWQRVSSSELTPREMSSPFIVIVIERLFKIPERKTTIMKEVKCGVIHFVSCSFILAVNPTLLSFHDDRNAIASATALSAGLSSILCGLFANLPFILAPTTSTSLYYSLYLQNRSVSSENGKVAIFLLGILFALCGLRIVATTITKIIPYSIKVGICLGVGLLIALEALTEIGLVRSGEHTVLDIGNFNEEIYIAMLAFVGIGLALHYRIRGAFLLGLSFGTIAYWLLAFFSDRKIVDQLTWHSVFIQDGDIHASLNGDAWKKLSDSKIYRLIFDLYIIGIILLNGLGHGLGETAELRRHDQSLPRGKWLYAICGIGTMFSAILGSGPIMISPESAPGIKHGARTGLASVTCGILFLLSTVVCPLFASTPASGTSPVLLMIGMMLFENAKNVNWSSIKEALPVFLMMIFIPFTYSIFNGVLFGLGIFLILYIATDHAKVKKKIKKLMSLVKRPLSSYSNGNTRTTSTRVDHMALAHDLDRDHLSSNNDEGSDDETEEENGLEYSLSFELNEITSSSSNPTNRLDQRIFARNIDRHSSRATSIQQPDEEICFDDVNQLSQSLLSLIGDRYVSLDGEDIFSKDEASTLKQTKPNQSNVEV